MNNPVEVYVENVKNTFQINIGKTETNLLCNYLAKTLKGKTVSKQEVEQFIYRCATSGANPLQNEIYAIPYSRGGVHTITTIFSYHFKLKKFNELCGVASIKDWVEEIEKQGGKVVEAKGVCEIKKKGSDDVFRTEVFLSEYNKGTDIWKTKPLTMIKKVAVSQCIDRAAPAGLEHMVTVEEFAKEKSVATREEVQKTQAKIEKAYPDFLEQDKAKKTEGEKDKKPKENPFSDDMNPFGDESEMISNEEFAEQIKG